MSSLKVKRDDGICLSLKQEMSKQTSSKRKMIFVKRFHFFLICVYTNQSQSQKVYLHLGLRPIIDPNTCSYKYVKSYVPTYESKHIYSI